uniref:Coat protein n=1 Tax=Soybean mild yellows Bangladesh virus TaxID=3074303 RepID=A0AA51UMV5_9VIRU|nr:coat protein [Soybean mild yellows Bangladesh virus]
MATKNDGKKVGVNEEHIPYDETNSNNVIRESGGASNNASLNLRDLVTPEHMNPEKLGGIVVYSNRADVMTEEDELKFETCMRDFAKKFVFKKVDGEPTADEFMGFYVSLVQSWLTQSTSLKNARQRHLSNTLSVNGQKYTWRTSEFMDFVKGNIPHVQNPFRQYARRHEADIELLKAAGKVQSDHHLQAKHGVLSQYWNIPADYVNGSLINISDDDLAANLLMKCQALKGTNQERKFYNVSQLAPGGCGK